MRAHFKNTAFVLAIAVLLLSCTKEEGGIIDVPLVAPVLLSASVQHSIINVDSDTSTNVFPEGAGKFRIMTTVGAILLSPPGNPGVSSVSFAIYGPRSGRAIASGSLIPAGGTADTMSFASTVQFSVNRVDAGLYVIDFQAQNTAGLSSNSLRKSLLITRNNSAPILGTPSLRRFTPAASDSSRFTLSISVFDSNGFADINNVRVRALRAIDSSYHPMYDNGLSANGDAFPGDGIFSAILWVRPVGSLQDVEFEFSANDLQGAASQPVRRSVQNHPPEIVHLTVPDSIQRPTVGDRLITFFLAAADSDGLGDIDSVYFINISSQNPTPFLMYDDGSCCLIPPENVPSGDSTAGDGTYSRTVRVDASTTLGDKEFHFHVVDKAGDRDLVIRIIRIYQ